MNSQSIKFSSLIEKFCEILWEPLSIIWQLSKNNFLFLSYFRPKNDLAHLLSGLKSISLFCMAKPYTKENSCKEETFTKEELARKFLMRVRLNSSASHESQLVRIYKS